MSRITSDYAKQRRSVQRFAQRGRADVVVKARARCGSHFRCEVCEQIVDVIQTAHAFGKGGRRSGIPEHWASTPQLCAALCCSESYGLTRLGCHELADRNVDADIKRTMQVQAARRLVVHISETPEVDWERMTAAGYQPQDIVREMIRVAAAEGIEP